MTAATAASIRRGESFCSLASRGAAGILRSIAAPLERCAELLGVDLATIRRAASDVELYIRVDGTKLWSLMQLERRLRPAAYGRVRDG
jgi:hypothetical protein